MNKIIKLECDKTISMLAGFNSGKIMYEKQVKGKVDFNDKITIVFPDHIDNIASSFVQGFFDEFMDKIGIDGIEEKISIESVHPELEKYIIDNLM